MGDVDHIGKFFWLPGALGIGVHRDHAFCQEWMGQAGQHAGAVVQLLAGAPVATTVLLRSWPAPRRSMQFMSLDICYVTFCGHCLVPQPMKQVAASADLSIYVRKLACLGDYPARSHNPPPGNTVIWRGLVRLTEIEPGFELALVTVGD